MRVTLILEFPESYCYLARGIAQVYLLFFYIRPIHKRKILLGRSVFTPALRVQK